MPMLTIMEKVIPDALVGGTDYDRFDSSNAHIAVGNGTTAFSAAHTDLQGGSKLRQGMDSGYPSVTDNTITFRATFGKAEANFAWEEWGVANAASGGQMMNRVKETVGTKTSLMIWQWEVEIEFINGDAS